MRLLLLAAALAQAGILGGGRAGPQPKGDGQRDRLRLTRDGSVGTQATHASYQEAVLRGNVYLAQIQVAQITNAIGNTSLGFLIYNPNNSGVQLVVLEGTFNVTTCSGASLVYVVSTNTATSPPLNTTSLAGFPRNAMIGGPNTSRAAVFTGARIKTAGLAARTILGCASVAGSMSTIDPVDGKLVILPGSILTIQASAITGLVFGLEWEEVPYP